MIAAPPTADPAEPTPLPGEHDTDLRKAIVEATAYITNGFRLDTIRPWERDETPGTVRICGVCELPKLVVRFDRLKRRRNSGPEYYFACVMCRRIMNRARAEQRKQNRPTGGAATALRRYYRDNLPRSRLAGVERATVTHWHHWEWPPTGDTWTSHGLCTHQTRREGASCRFHNRFTLLGGCALKCTVGESRYHGDPPVGYSQYPTGNRSLT